mmetsp:Transcript_42/g.89  ORF Transcript_42/g.89 Transcript_42/m.89 type:complete len:248 (+) Transcript_42:92-835(+)
MKVFVAVSALALIFAPVATDAELPNASKRQRDGSGGDVEWGRQRQHRQMIRGGTKLRQVEMSMSTPDMTVEPAEPTVTNPASSTTVIATAVPCSILIKKKCRKQPLCTWNWESNICAFISGIEPIETAPVTTTTTSTTTNTDPCSIVSRKQCKKDLRCTWGNGSCFSSPTASSVISLEGNARPMVDTRSSSPTNSPSTVAADLTPFPTYPTRKLAKKPSSEGMLRKSELSWEEDKRAGITTKRSEFI